MPWQVAVRRPLHRHTTPARARRHPPSIDHEATRGARNARTAGTRVGYRELRLICGRPVGAAAIGGEPWLVAAGVLLVVALIAANGYFVAAEFSFVAARRTRLVEAHQHGGAAAGPGHRGAAPPVVHAVGAHSSASPSPRCSWASSPSRRSGGPCSRSWGPRRARGGKRRGRAVGRLRARHREPDGLRRAGTEEPRHRPARTGRSPSCPQHHRSTCAWPDRSSRFFDGAANRLLRPSASNRSRRCRRRSTPTSFPTSSRRPRRPVR
jgi:hypothetical protein